MSALLVVLLAQHAAAAPFNDSKHKFSFEVPEGYVRQDESAGALHRFVHGSLEAGDWAELHFVGLGGTIGRANANHEIAEKSAREAAAKNGVDSMTFQYRTVTWQGYPLEVMVLLAELGDRTSITYAAQVPLLPEAVQVMVTCDKQDDVKRFAEFTQVVASVRGETNWTETFSESERLGFAVGLAAVPCTIFVVVIAWLLFRKKKPDAR